MRALLALAALALAAGCATSPVERMPVMVSSGEHEATRSVARVVEARLDATPQFRRGGVTDSLRIGVDEAVELSGGRRYELDVEYVLAGNMSGRKIWPTGLGRQKVRCPADKLERCAERIIAAAAARMPEARKRIAKAPVAAADLADPANSITTVN